MEYISFPVNITFVHGIFTLFKINSLNFDKLILTFNNIAAIIFFKERG